MKNYMNNPRSYLVSERLNQLIQIYGKSYVASYINSTINPHNSMLELHLYNLKVFAGDVLFFEILGIVFAPVTNSFIKRIL